MKKSFPLILGLAFALSLTAASAQPASQSPGYVDFGELAPSEEGEFVEVNIKQNLINMVAKLTERDEPEVTHVLRNLESVRVNVVSLNDDNRSQLVDKVRSIRSQLDGKGWERIVTVKDGAEDIGIYTLIRGEEAFEGIVITVIDGDNEAVLVNIVGNIKPEEIAMVGERLNLDPLKQISENMGQ